ncbi:hypothetical protein [Streptomyces sp. NPDC058307]|uniref:hypothetical protein n=1 Tax=Streptomyces sp. NPDC058307 TaxID=3346439 RepID=UPI0036F16F0D
MADGATGGDRRFAADDLMAIGTLRALSRQSAMYPVTSASSEGGDDGDVLEGGDGVTS